MTVVILNWNEWERTLRCLASLDYSGYPNFEILVVDNGSENQSQTRIEAARQDVDLIQTRENLGYAGGNNTGIRYAMERGADYVWVLNNDVVVEADTLTELIKTASSDPRTGITGANVAHMGEDETRKVAMSAYYWKGERIRPAECPETEDYQPVDVVTGTSVLLSTRMLRQIGGFDERFFHYFEDVELCERAKKAGWKVVHACRARVWHSVGSSLSNSSAQARYYYIRNWLLFSQWSGRRSVRQLFFRDPILTIARVFGVLWLLKGKWKVAIAGTLGAFDALRGKYGKRDLTR